jgi:hypothetical protein
MAKGRVLPELLPFYFEIFILLSTRYHERMCGETWFVPGLVAGNSQ